MTTPLLSIGGTVLSGCLSVGPCVQQRVCVPKAFERDIFWTAWKNSAKFTALVRLATNMNWSNFEVKRLKVKAMTSPNMVKKAEAYVLAALPRRVLSSFFHIISLCGGGLDYGGGSAAVIKALVSINVYLR